MEASSEAYLEPCQTFKMEFFAKIVSGFSFFILFAKSFIIDVWQDSEFASEASNDLRKKLHVSCLIGFLIDLVLIFFAKLFPACLLNLINIFHHESAKLRALRALAPTRLTHN